MSKWERLNKEFDKTLNSMTYRDWHVWYEKFNQKQFNQNKMKKEKNQDLKEMNLKLHAQLLINQFYELETNGEKMDYDTAVECAKIASKTIIESGDLSLPEDRLYWRSILKQCDLLHSQEYLMASLKRDEKIYSHAVDNVAQGTPTEERTTSHASTEVDNQLNINSIDKHWKENFAVSSDKVITIGSDESKCKSNPEKNAWYLCRLKEGDIKLCFWNGTHWENLTQNEIDSFPIVIKWVRLDDVKKLMFLL